MDRGSRVDGVITYFGEHMLGVDEGSTIRQNDDECIGQRTSWASYSRPRRFS